jgi:ferric-dicitrate binding protein FerR (iron transport regulator)
MWWVTRLGTDRAVTRALSVQRSEEPAAAPGQTGTLTLDDSTKVMLAAGSKLIDPEAVREEMRAVKVEGAARFTVAPGNPQPFEIRVGDAAVHRDGYHDHRSFVP